MPDDKVALITGAAQRIGAVICQHLHDAGYRVIVHYRQSAQAAQTLCQQLNVKRRDSARSLQADLLDTAAIEQLAANALQEWGRLDVLVNNASSFYPTPVGTATSQHWDDLVGSNMKAPFFLAQAVAPALSAHNGCIVNIVDIYARHPLRAHPVYCAAKAGLAMLTQALALELAPQVRVNGVAPGAILWPATEPDEAQKQVVIDAIPLKRSGHPLDIAKTVLFLARDADYITGHIIAVDGGRSLAAKGC